MSIERPNQIANNDLPIASVHIPKTAGSTLRKFWIDLYGAENVELYSINTGRFHNAAEDVLLSRTNPLVYFCRDLLTKTRLKCLYRLIMRTLHDRRIATGDDQLPAEFKVVHGHFSPDYIEGFGRKVRLVTVIRDPFERTLSQYFFLRKLEDAGHENLPPWYKPGMNLEEFAFLPEMVNYQAKFIRRPDLTTFDVVGTTEKLDCFCRRFDPQGKVPLARLNTTSRPQITLSTEFMTRFKEAYSLDYQLYNDALIVSRQHSISN